MKNLRKKGLLLGALSVLCLSSVGFASWVITNNDTQAAEGNISAEAVVNNAVKLSLKWVDGAESSTELTTNGKKPMIHFGKSGTKGPDWLSNAHVDPSALTCYLHITVDNLAGLDKVDVSITSEQVTDGKLLKLPENPASIPASEFKSDGGKGGTKVVTLTFSWGSLFVGGSPEAYFADKKIDGDSTLTKTSLGLAGVTGEESLTWGQLADTLLTEANKLATSATYNVKVAATAKTTAE